MKKNSFILAIVAIALAVLMPNVQAQQGSFDTVTVVAGGTNYVAGSTTITSGTASGGVGVSRNDIVGLLISFKPVATNVTGNVVFTFAKGLNASEVESTGSVTVTMATDTNAVATTSFTATTVTGAGYLKLTSINNGCSVAVTNVSVKAIRKAPGTIAYPR